MKRKNIFIINFIKEILATEGTGIGLAIVKKIVSLHSGTIDVDSNKNETTFIVTLPLNL